jgi:hypothetical protein
MTLTKTEAINKAKRELAATGETQFIVRRGDEYRVHPASEKTPRGYRVAEMISPGNVQNF